MQKNDIKKLKIAQIPVASGNIQFITEIHDKYIRLIIYEDKRNGELGVNHLNIPLDGKELAMVKDLIDRTIQESKHQND